jgi:hypothetical protein
MTRRHASLRDQIALALLGLALAMRVLVPAGWMPATAQGFAIAICSGSTTQAAWVDGEGKVHKQAPAPAGDQHCAFAGLGLPMLGGDVPLVVQPERAQAPLATTQALASIGHGLAAPPPPATGPPATV